MGYEAILYDVSEAIATITLNRPDKLNAWNGTMEAEVRAAMGKAEADDSVRVIILTGAGRGFCAGADMNLLQDISGDSGGGEAAGGSGNGSGSRREAAIEANKREGVREDFQKQYSYFPSIQKPIIAAINGAAAGLGFIHMLYCDMRFCSDRAKFTTAFSRRGLIAEHGVSWLLPRIVGMAHAMDLLLSARKFEAQEALRMNLVNRVIPHDHLMEETRAYAIELATMVSPRSISVMKKQLWDAQFMNLAEATEIANGEMLASFPTEDFKEGVAHFVEKRMPVFTGR